MINRAEPRTGMYLGKRRLSWRRTGGPRLLPTWPHAASTVVDSFVARLMVHARLLLQVVDIMAQHVCRGVRSLINQAALGTLT